MWVGTVIVLMMVFLLLSSCGNKQEIRDLENIPQTQPDKVRLVTNVNEYPNIVALCIDGAGFATTTRPDRGAIIRVEVWDRGWCQSQSDGAAVTQ